ncbi:hypothetical protein APY04_2067 [Hyphomicrobium sulfonivorans]|uniref:Uncharacterized protein n=1 Tax=Hyphomicrobium sulfonivorans TaxID=121290 RepID=A0A120CV10_HYPSL|nr:hypothetical protein APY04_2067 [Hyphomicrobium sulfonivorans]
MALLLTDARAPTANGRKGVVKACTVSRGCLKLLSSSTRGWGAIMAHS